MSARLSTSRAYWNLRAEQVMDRVFSDGERTLEAVQVQLDPAPAHQRAQPDAPVRLEFNRWLLAAIAVPTFASVGISGWLARNWQLTHQALNRERDLQMIERLRSLPVPQPEALARQTNGAAEAGRPSEEPEATAVAEIRLPATLEPVMIPVPDAPRNDAAPPLSLGAPVPPAAPAAAEPLLVGVVHAGGGKGSAIFRLDQLSLSASPGEMIGNSGWRLQSVQAEGAVIERQGLTRRLSVGGAF